MSQQLDLRAVTAFVKGQVSFDLIFTESQRGIQDKDSRHYLVSDRALIFCALLYAQIELYTTERGRRDRARIAVELSPSALYKAIMPPGSSVNSSVMSAASLGLCAKLGRSFAVLTLPKELRDLVDHYKTEESSGISRYLAAQAADQDTAQQLFAELRHAHSPAVLAHLGTLLSKHRD